MNIAALGDPSFVLCYLIAFMGFSSIINSFLMSATQRLTCCAAQLCFAMNPPGTPQRHLREANLGFKGCPGEVQGTPEESLEGTKNSVCAHTESRDPSETPPQGPPKTFQGGQVHSKTSP